MARSFKIRQFGQTFVCFTGEEGSALYLQVWIDWSWKIWDHTLINQRPTFDMAALLLIIHYEEERESSLVVNFETKEVHKSSGSYGKHLPSMEWDTKNPGDSQFKSVGPKIVILQFGSKISAMKVIVATTATMPITIPKKGFSIPRTDGWQKHHFQ